jgi:hypothetical protein
MRPCGNAQARRGSAQGRRRSAPGRDGAGIVTHEAASRCDGHSRRLRGGTPWRDGLCWGLTRVESGQTGSRRGFPGVRLVDGARAMMDPAMRSPAAGRRRGGTTSA